MLPPVDTTAWGLVPGWASDDDRLGCRAPPRHHDDPFDRALVAQARAEGLRLVTADQAMAAYDVLRLDASR